MSIPDLINGVFELTGGVLFWLDVRRLLKDRRIKGVDWRVRGFFSAWGLANIGERDAVYVLNKEIWNACPRPQRGALRQRALALIDERQ